MATVTMDAMDPKSKGLAKLLKKNKVKMEILTMRGPSGWPEVELTGKREDLETVLADGEYGWDDPELAEYIEESADVNEAKITLKRRYTENHPAVTVGKAARIRNKMLEAIADGALTEEEFNNILSEYSANAKQWMKRNARFFNVSEEGIALSKFGKKALSAVVVNEEESVTESEAENILDDLLDERGGDMGELHGMEMEDALDTVEAYGHKGSKAKKIAQELFALTNESNKNSIQEGRAFAAAAKKAKDSDEEEFEFNGKKFPVTIKEKKVVTEWLHTNFSNFTSTLNEAFSSQLLASLFKKENGKLDNSLAKAFYGKTKIAMDKVQDEDLISTTPSAAYKAKGGNTITFYISDNEKNNIYASEDAGYYNKTIPGGGYLLAVTSGDNKFYDNAWANRYTATDKSRTLVERPNKSNDTIGISKKYKGWDGTGLYNVKRISEVADRAVVVNVDLLQQKYSTTNKRDERNAAKSGATAFKSDKDFKAENKNRYEIILQNKAAKLPLDKIVADAIDLLTDQIKQGLAKGEKGKYGDLIIGISPNGRETKMRDASNHMSNILDNYARYVDYVKQEEDSVAQYGQSESWYARSIKQYAKAIKDGVDKIESFNYAW